MKYLLSYKGFCRFVKEWEVILHEPIDSEPSVIQMQKGHGMIGSHSITADKDGIYHGDIYFINGGCFTAEVEREPINVTPAGIAGDSFTFSLPVKYHKVPQYHIHYKDTVTQCILVDEQTYKELKQVGLAR